MHAYNNLERLREIILLERFYEFLSDDLRVWLVDKDPPTLVEAAKLADTYTVNHHNYTMHTENKHYNNNSKTALPLQVRVTDQANANHQNKTFDKKFSKDKYEQGKTETSRYTPTNNPIVFFKCFEINHKAKNCIFDKAKEHIKCNKCALNGHYARDCNLKTNALVQRIQPTYCTKTMLKQY